YGVGMWRRPVRPPDSLDVALFSLRAGKHFIGSGSFFDDPTAQAHVVLIEDDILAGCDGTLRLVEAHFARSICSATHLCCLVGLSITDLCRATEFGIRRCAGHPRELRGDELAAEQCRMVMTLYDNEHVALQIL